MHTLRGSSGFMLFDYVPLRDEFFYSSLDKWSSSEIFYASYKLRWGNYVELRHQPPSEIFFASGRGAIELVPKASVHELNNTNSITVKTVEAFS
jgi:hypothetical protein